MSSYRPTSLADEHRRDLLEKAKRRHPSWPSPGGPRRATGRRLWALVSAVVTRWGLDEASWPLLTEDGGAPLTTSTPLAIPRSTTSSDQVVPATRSRR